MPNERPSTALAYVSNAERAIAKADTIPEITDLVAKAKAFREYMRDVGICSAACRQCARRWKKMGLTA